SHRRVPVDHGRSGKLSGADSLQGGAAPHRLPCRRVSDGVSGLVAAPGVAGNEGTGLWRLSLHVSERLYRAVRRVVSTAKQTTGGVAVKILDRLIIMAYIRSYAICVVSLLSLYIVIDLCTNLDQFFSKGLVNGLEAVGTYYLYRSSQMFDRLCEPIVLAAGMFTVAWIQRNNELMPLLSAGVPTRRVLRPVLFGAMFLLGLGIANQELVIPRIAHVLVRDRDDLDGAKNQYVQATYDANGIHIEGGQAQRHGMLVTEFHCSIPDKQGYGLAHLSAREARYIPASHNIYSGGWMLT